MGRVRQVLAIACQKVFFEEGHDFYHYGPIESPGVGYRAAELDLQVASSGGGAPASVSREKRGNKHSVIVTDRVYEHSYLREILSQLCTHAKGVRIKTDDPVLNLSLLSLMLDFGLWREHVGLLNLPFLRSLGEGATLDPRQLQVEASNWLNEFDKRNAVDSVTRLKVCRPLLAAAYRRDPSAPSPQQLPYLAG